MADEEEFIHEKRKKTLLEKFDVPIDHLSYEYVNSCKSEKELEKIIKILRSGEEGWYPDLNQVAENKLKELNPNSKVLLVEQPVLNKGTMGAELWNQVTSEINEWSGKMKSQEEELRKITFNGKDDKHLPAVRTKGSVKEQIDNSNNAAGDVPVVKKRSVVPRDYSAWDKFDVDKELLRLNVEEERSSQEKERKRRQRETVAASEAKNIYELNRANAVTNTENLLDLEKQVLANNEREKGNEYYNVKDFNKAIDHYSASLNILPTSAAFNNRAMAYLKLNNFEAVLSDCDEVLKRDENNVKALLRRGVAHQNKTNFQKAYEDFSKVLELDPKNMFAKSQADQMQKQCLNKRKSVRLKIEEQNYSSGSSFAFGGLKTSTKMSFPEPKEGYNTSWPVPYSDPSKVLASEYGTAKRMCYCGRTRSRPPQICRLCELSRRSAGERPGTSGLSRDAIKNILNSDECRITEVKEENAHESEEKGSKDMKSKEKEESLSSRLNIGVMKSSSESIHLENNKSETKNISFEESKSSPEPKHKESSDLNPNNKSLDDKKSSPVLESKHKEKSDTKLKKVASNNNNTLGVKTANLKSHLRETREDGLGKPHRLQVADKYVQSVAKEPKETSTNDAIHKVQGLDRLTLQNGHSLSSPYEFLRTWRSIKYDPDLSLHADLLRQVSPNDLSKVIGAELDCSMLSIIIRCLEKHFIQEKSIMSQILINLSNLPRFNIAKSFLADDMKVLEKLLQNMDVKDIPHNLKGVLDLNMVST